MNNPYYINEQAAISFSGGRTSAYMLFKVLEAHGGTLPGHIKCVIANTGKEMPETLDFVRDCGEQWGVPIVWVEARVRPGGEDENKYVYETIVVNHATASRKGEPFESLIQARQYLPNPVARFCTAELKVLRIGDYLKSVGFESDCLHLIGIRYDEPRRAAKMHNKNNDGHPCWCPLFEDRKTKEDVGNFWKSQNFDLNLPNVGGVTDWGNCDLCFLKGKAKKISLIRERPDLADWWIKQEEILIGTKNISGKFRKDHHDYKALKMIATDQSQLFEFDDESIPCFCGD